MSKTIVLHEDDNSNRRAFVIPNSDPRINSEIDDEGFSWGTCSPAYSRRTTMEIPLNFYTMIVGEDSENPESLNNNAIGSAISTITDHFEQIAEESRKARRRTAAESLLESQGIGPKKAAKLAEAIIAALDEVK